MIGVKTVFKIDRLFGKSARTENCHTGKSYKSNVVVSLHNEKVINKIFYSNYI